METFPIKEEVTTTSRLVGVVPGSPPKINLVDYTTGRSGVKRHFTRQVAVLDSQLLERLQREVSIGDEIRATVINEYRKNGYDTYLADFKKMPTPKPNGANGTISLTTNSITEIVIPPVRDEETIVQH